MCTMCTVAATRVTWWAMPSNELVAGDSQKDELTLNNGCRATNFPVVRALAVVVKGSIASSSRHRPANRDQRKGYSK
jgi:hypothetical protein